MKISVIQMIMVALIIGATIFHIHLLANTLAGLLFGLSLVFYTTIVSLMMGLYKTSLNLDIDWKERLISSFIIISAVLTALIIPEDFNWSVVFAIPWVLIFLSTHLISFLIDIGYLEYRILDKKDEDQE